jgi:hypothetical protein
MLLAINVHRYTVCLLSTYKAHEAGISHQGHSVGQPRTVKAQIDRFLVPQFEPLSTQPLHI